MSKALSPQKPVLFLDFDGVLHPDAVYRERGRIALRREGISLFEWAPLLASALAPHSEVKIVLSTSWVRVLGFDRSKERLPQALKERVIGATYHSRMRVPEGLLVASHPFTELTRYEQILRYVNRHRCGRWLAIDDDVEHWGAEHAVRLVATDSELGLAEPGKLEEFSTKLAWLLRS